ncbi:MAG: peroxiredoxin family protein [Saprospiraceae bacterium]
MKNTALVFLAIMMSATFNSCVFEGRFEGLAPGPWRASLLLDGRKGEQASGKKSKYSLEIQKFQFEEVSEGELPFIFEVTHTSMDSFFIEIINGEERIKVPTEHISYYRDRTNGHNKLRIDFPHYDAYIQGRFEENVFEGEYVLTTKDDYSIPFVAKQGQNYRFSQLRKPPKMDVSGEWEVTFGLDTDEPYKAIGEFKQDGNYLTGTFLTETGNYRYLEGTIQADKLYLSTFDGSHAFLFEAKILEDSSLIGSFRSGSHYRTLWEAKRNSNVELASEYELTYLKEGYDELAFSFPNTENKPVSLKDEAYDGKVKIVQILGTWCPNCGDETMFLSDYLNKNKNENLAVIGLAYERHSEFDKAAAAVNRMKKRFDVPYEMLIAGTSSKIEAAKTLPMLNAIISYPTMIFIGKKGKVRKIHTGFAGPATSKYDDFKKEFEETVELLLNE